MPRVLMISPKFPDETFWNATRVVRSLWGQGTPFPPLGLLTVATYLPSDFEIRLVDRNVVEEQHDDLAWADVVFLSAMLCQKEDYLLCVRRAREHGKPIATGGVITHSLPEAVAEHADWMCIGEAETIMEDLVADLRADRRGKIYHGSTKTDMALVRTARFDLIPDISAYTHLSIQISRGCPHECEFCDVIAIHGRKPRVKNPAQVLAELDVLKRLGHRGPVLVVDDNLIAHPRKAKAVLAEIATWSEENDYIFTFRTQAALDLAEDDELLAAMQRANFDTVFLGVETPDRATLLAMNKRQNLKGSTDLLAKLNKIRKHGMHVIAGFVVGFDGERSDVFETQRMFIEASGIAVAMLSLLGAFPKTRLTARLEAEGRLLDILADGNVTVSGINFVPKGQLTKRQYLLGYSALITQLYEPRNFFARNASGAMSLAASVAATQRSSLNVRFNSASVARVKNQLRFLTPLLWQVGVRDKESRFYFWQALLRVARKNRPGLMAFFADTARFIHLKEHARNVGRASMSYLASPSPSDELDQVAT